MREEKKQQVIALGRLGWSLRHIERATRVRHETADVTIAKLDQQAKVKSDTQAAEQMQAAKRRLFAGLQVRRSA